MPSGWNMRSTRNSSYDFPETTSMMRPATLSPGPYCHFEPGSNANSDFASPVWMSFPVKTDGTIGEGKVFFDSAEFVKAKRKGLPDGMKVDVNGNLWATGPGGLHVFAPDGTLLGTLDTGVNTANCCFGGDDGSMLYVACDHDIGRIKTTTTGRGF